MRKHKVGPNIRRHAQSYLGQAMTQARTMEAPVLKGLQAQEAHYNDQESQREQNNQGFAEALAELLKGAGPATQSAYDNAAGATAGFAKGFSDAEQHRAADEGASLSSFLDKAGIPHDAAAQALGHVGGTSDVLYGLSGYEPASNMEREGAAFTAAADQLPAYAAGLGEQGLTQLRNAAKDQTSQYEQQIAGERSKIPALAQQILNQMMGRQQQQESIDIQRQYLGNADRASQISATGVDPVTGQTKPGYYKDKHGNVLPDGYVSKNGRVYRPSTARGSKGSGFGSALGSQQHQIYSDAAALVKTTQSSDPLAGLPGHPATTTQAPPYAEAAKQLFNEYKYLLRQVPSSKRPKAKRLLNQTIREALSAAGITPSSPQPSQPTHPGTNP